MCAKVAIVTGAASGLGFQLAAQLKKSGCKVVLIDKEQVFLEGAESKTIDVRNVEALREAIVSTKERYGRLDYLFNNAACAILGEVKDLSLEDWNKVLSVNLQGSINGINAAYPLMMEQKFGHIVNISSLTGITPAVMMIPYVTSKYALVGLSHSLRLEAKEWGINVSVACPNLVDTPIWSTTDVVGSKAKRPLDFLSLFTPQPKLLSAEKAAAAILKGVKKNKSTIFTDFYSRALFWSYRMTPELWMWCYDKLISTKFRSMRE